VDELFEAEKLLLFKDILDRGLMLCVKVTGRSMSPFLAGGEILKIQKVPASSLQIGDLIFFKTRLGFPMLHRIVKKGYEEDLYIFRTKGDASLSMDEPVSGSDILGKVNRVKKRLSGGKTIDIDMESFFWRSINYLMVFISRGRSIISRLF
jgi:signal peptidase I